VLALLGERYLGRITQNSFTSGPANTELLRTAFGRYRAFFDLLTKG
jgi:hypothetical protein